MIKVKNFDSHITKSKDFGVYLSTFSTFWGHFNYTVIIGIIWGHNNHAFETYKSLGPSAKSC